MAKAKLKNQITVVLTLNEDEALALTAILGKSNVGGKGGSILHPVYTTLNNAGLDRDKIRMFNDQIQAGNRWRTDDSPW